MPVTLFTKIYAQIQSSLSALAVFHAISSNSFAKCANAKYDLSPFQTVLPKCPHHPLASH